MLSVTKLETCPCCSNENIVKNGFTKTKSKRESSASGQTNHIERYWATLRARITHYIRKSLSFSRKLRYHHLVTKMFMVDYNQNYLSTLF
jgi:IS1 family transposase